MAKLEQQKRHSKHKNENTHVCTWEKNLRNSTYSDAEHDKLKTAGLLSGPEICVNLVLNPRGKLLAFEVLNSAFFDEKNIKLAVMITLSSLASG